MCYRKSKNHTAGVALLHLLLLVRDIHFIGSTHQPKTNSTNAEKKVQTKDIGSVETDSSISIANYLNSNIYGFYKK